MQQRPPAEHWTLDKRIPLALIVVVIANSVGIVWMASKLDSRVFTLEEKEVQRTMRDGETQLLMNRVTRVETEFIGANRSIERIERKVDRVLGYVQSGNNSDQ